MRSDQYSNRPSQNPSQTSPRSPPTEPDLRGKVSKRPSIIGQDSGTTFKILSIFLRLKLSHFCSWARELWILRMCSHMLIRSGCDPHLPFHDLVLCQGRPRVWASSHLSSRSYTSRRFLEYRIFDAWFKFSVNILGARGPGVFFVLPCIDEYRCVDLRTVYYNVPPQEVLTKDSVSCRVDAVVFYNVFAPKIAVANVADYRYGKWFPIARFPSHDT